jgi:hypothetical protein
MKIRLRVWDICALAFSLAVTVFFFRHAYGAQGGEPRLYIQEESQTLVYLLSEDRDFSVSGPLGETRISVQGGAAAVTDSPCRDKLCVSMGHIGKRGGWIACLPNRVFLRIETPGPSDEGEVDAAAY